MFCRIFFLVFYLMTVEMFAAVPLRSGSECQQRLTDIFFLMDSSSSIETKDFSDQLKFVADIVDELEMAANQIHVGLATFSDYFYLSIDLTNNKDSFLSMLSNVFPLSGSTRIGRALNYLQMDGFGSPLAREKATRIAIIITDGESVDNPLPKAEELKSQGVKIFTIEAKDVYNKVELRLIASKPTYRYYFPLHASNVRKAIVRTISNIGCNVPEIRENCRLMQNRGFMFLIDLAGFGRIKSNQIMELTVQAIRRLEQKKLNSFFDIHFSSISNQSLENIPSVSNVTALMERFNHVQFPGPQGIIRSFIRHPEHFKLIRNKKKMVVIFLDESSEPLEDLKAEIDDFRSKDKYAAIFIITVGAKVRIDQAKKMASDPNLYLHIPNASGIATSYEDFIDLLCNPQDYNENINFHDLN